MHLKSCTGFHEERSKLKERSKCCRFGASHFQATDFHYEIPVVKLPIPTQNYYTCCNTQFMGEKKTERKNNMNLFTQYPLLQAQSPVK